MSSVDIDHLKSFIGRSEMRRDVVRVDTLTQFRGTLEGHLVDEKIATVPPGFHWTLFPPLNPLHELREDGHPASLGLLPELPFPTRMWAGGEVRYLARLEPGDEIERASVVQSVDLKSGSTGELLFVTIEHELSRAGSPVISETQSIVYKHSTPQGPSADQGKAIESDGPFCTDSRLLFRYSALTFNAHRIHYDRDYARDVEGYRDLVVHGPLQATCMMNRIAEQFGHSQFKFSYRGRAPLFAGDRATILIDPSGEAKVQRKPDDVTMAGTFEALKI